MEKLDEINKEFNYTDKVKKNWGKFWFERYSKKEELYSTLLNSRNAKVLASVKGGEHMLDIGSGFGDMLYFLKDKFRYVYGVDPSLNMVEASRHNLTTRGVSNFEVSQGVIQKLPFADDFFDCILLLDVFEHIWPQDIDISLAEVKRILKKGGQFIMVTPSRKKILFWTKIDNLLTGMVRGKQFVKEHKTDGTFTEIFYEKSEIRKHVYNAGMKVITSAYISFYPAPERPGFLGTYMGRIQKRKYLYAAVKKVFGLVESLRFLNQKMFFIITK